MDHAEIKEMLGVYALHACSPAETTIVELHLERCESCAAEVARFEEVSGWIGAGEARTPPPALRSRVLAAAERDDSSRSC